MAYKAKKVPVPDAKRSPKPMSKRLGLKNTRGMSIEHEDGSITFPGGWGRDAETGKLRRNRRAKRNPYTDPTPPYQQPPL